MLQPEKRRIGSRVNALTSVPVRGIPLVEVTGNKRVLIENHAGVTSYGQNEICIKVFKGSVEVTGEHLEILCMSKDRIIICGIIFCVRLREEEV